MHIAFDSQAFEYQRYGGVSRYFYELLRRLPDYDGAEISVHQGYHINRYAVADLAPRLKFYRGSLRPDIPKSGLAFTLWNRCSCYHWLKKIQPEIVHFTYFGPNIQRSKRNLSVKRVVTVFDLIHELFPEMVGGRDPTAQRKRAAVRDADLILAISERTREDIIEFYGAPPEKIKAIPLANALKLTPAATPSIDGPYLLYVGERLQYKNFERVYEVYRRNQKINREYRLVCFGGPGFSPDFLSDLHNAGLSDRVLHLRGDDQSLANLYAHASVFVYPSFYEGFGIPPLEAMSYGCPVVAAEAGSIPEVVGDAARLFDPRSADELEAGLLAVLSDAALRQDLISRGEQREAQFSWDRCAEETMKCYRELAGRG